MWEAIRSLWNRALKHARAVTAQSAAGFASSSHEVRAAGELLRLDNNVSFQDLACTAMSMYRYQDARPTRFCDDQAFRWQLVRKVRALDHLAVYERWNPKRMLMHRVYRDIPPRVVALLASYLGEVFGAAARLLGDHEKAHPKIPDELAVMQAAVKALK